MTSLPLFSYPTKAILVDDDKLFLDAVSHALCQEFRLQSFNDSKSSLQFINNHRPFLSTVPFLRGCIEHENYETINHLPVDLNSQSFQQIRENHSRYQEVSVMLVDYNMPFMNGIDLCRQLKSSPIKKVLLTGEVDHVQAVKAFNEGIIDRFIQKDSPNLLDQIRSHLSGLSCEYLIENTAPLLRFLESNQKLPISDSIFISFFKSWCMKNNIREYYLIDKLGNFALTDQNNKEFYFIVYSDRVLNDFVELHKEDDEVADLIQKVKNREFIPFFGVGQEGWQVDSSKWASCFYQSQMIAGRERYFWTVVEGSNNKYRSVCMDENMVCNF